MDTGTDDILQAPFPVIVAGINREILGAGQVIGCLEDSDGVQVPVIELEDPKSKRGVVELAGDECYWLSIEDRFTKTLSSDAGRAATTPAALYAYSIRSN